MSAAKGLQKLLRVSPQLRKVVGQEEISRPQAIKKLWEYIKKHDCQDKADKRIILCDHNLKDLFQTDRVHMLEMGKKLNPHFQRS